jgi:hypothetical protein
MTHICILIFTGICEYPYTMIVRNTGDVENVYTTTYLWGVGGIEPRENRPELNSLWRADYGSMFTWLVEYNATNF